MKVYNIGDDGRTIDLFYKNEHGKKLIKSIETFPWYFCIKTSDFEKIRGFLNDWRAQPKYVTIGKEIGEVYTKIFCDKSNYEGMIAFFKELKQKFPDVETFEGDLTLSRRYAIDTMVEVEDNIEWAFFDIETDDSIGEIDIGAYPILSYALCDKRGNTIFHKAKSTKPEDEKDLLKQFLNDIDKYEVIVGWNSHNFDLPYIQSRMKKLGLKYFWKRTLHVDFMKRLIKLFNPVMSIIGLSGFSLEEVSKKFLGTGKVKFAGKVKDLYDNDPSTFKEYNINDVVLLHKLNEKLKTIELMVQECVWTGTFIDKFWIGELLDNYILREANRQGKRLPTRPTFEEAEARDNDESLHIRGGFVLEPVTGFYENIRVFDFKSLYPSIIVSFNIGIDSLDKTFTEEMSRDFSGWLGLNLSEQKGYQGKDLTQTPLENKIEQKDYSDWMDFLKAQRKKYPKENIHQSTNNQYFRDDFRSIIASLVERLLHERIAYKKMQEAAEFGSIEYDNSKAMQEVVKEMANSMYGITADRGSRYFDKRIAEAITLGGQWLIRTAREYFVEAGFKVIYGDTDSVFVQIPDRTDVDKHLPLANAYIIKRLKDDFGIDNPIVLLQYEKTFSTFLMLDKKRYVGQMTELDHKPTNVIFGKGTEAVRKDSTLLTKRVLNEMLELILIQRKNKDFFIEWLDTLKLRIETEEFSADDLAITQKVSKAIKDYKNKPPHVRLAEQEIKKKKIMETKEGKHAWGEKIEYIITDAEHGHQAVLKRDFNGEWDRRHYWEVKIFGVLERILKTAFQDEVDKDFWDDAYRYPTKSFVKGINRDRQKQLFEIEKEEKKKKKNVMRIQPLTKKDIEDLKKKKEQPRLF